MMLHFYLDVSSEGDKAISTVRLYFTTFRELKPRVL